MTDNKDMGTKEIKKPATYYGVSLVRLSILSVISVTIFLYGVGLVKSFGIAGGLVGGSIATLIIFEASLILVQKHLMRYGAIIALKELRGVVSTRRSNAAEIDLKGVDVGVTLGVTLGLTDAAADTRAKKGITVYPSMYEEGGPEYEEDLLGTLLEEVVQDVLRGEYITSLESFETLVKKVSASERLSARLHAMITSVLGQEVAPEVREGLASISQAYLFMFLQTLAGSGVLLVRSSSEDKDTNNNN